MDIYFWLQMMGALTALLLLLLMARLLTGRLILPAEAYAFLASAGLFACIVFLLAHGSYSSSPMRGLAAIWDQWLMIAPMLLPFVSGLLGWAALRTKWRWFYLGAGFGVLLLPYVVALILYWLGGR